MTITTKTISTRYYGTYKTYLAVQGDIWITSQISRYDAITKLLTHLKIK